jgi:stringent starvation protein B
MSDAPRSLPPKKDVALALLEREPSVFIHLDPRRPGVSVPKGFTGQPQLILQVGLNMAIPIPDLKVDEEGISCTLSFNRAPFLCHLPWHAIWALVSEDQRGMVWPEDIPPDLTVQKQRAPAGPQKPAKKPRPKLTAVESSGSDSERNVEVLAEDARARAKVRRPEGERDREAEEAPLRGAGGPVRPALAPVQRVGEAEDSDADGSGQSTPEPRRGSGKPKRELPPYLRVIK